MRTMMKKTVYLLAFVALLGGACKTKKTKVKPKTLEETTVADFATVLGLQKGDVYDKALKELGEPTKTTADEKNTYSFVSVYYDDANEDRMFSYTYDKNTKAVNHIRITGNRQNNFEPTRNYFKQRKISDIKVGFLGMHKDKILKIMGTPVRVNSGNYEFVDGPVSVTFICYDFHDELCSEIYVFWNYFYKEPAK